MLTKNLKETHICFVYPGYLPETHAGGIGVFIYEIVESLRDLSVHISIVSRSDKFNDKFEKLHSNVCLYRLGEDKISINNNNFSFRKNGFKKFQEKLLDKIIEINEVKKIDIIESCDWGAEANILLEKFKDILITRCHTPSFISESYNPSNQSYLSGEIKNEEKKLLSSVKRLICPSFSLANKIKKYVDIKTEIYIQPYPINLSDVPEKEFYTIDKTTPFKILIVGRIEERKGQDIIIKALNKFKDRNVELYIIGADTPSKNGKLISELFLKKADNEIRNRIIFINEIEREKMLSSYKDYDLYVAASRFDNFPFTVIEAMSAGLPVIGYEGGGIKEQIKDRQNGLFFNGKSDDLANKINELIDNELLRKSLGIKAKETSRDLYESKKVGKKIFNYYLDCIEDNKQNNIINVSRKKALDILRERNNFVHNDKHILNVENNIMLIANNLGLTFSEKKILRIAAHWHDTGRFDNEMENIPHEQLSVSLFKDSAKDMLLDKDLVDEVVLLISEHRNRESKKDIENNLAKVLWDADKLDIFNTDRMKFILDSYGTMVKLNNEFNYDDSFSFWENINFSFVNKFNTEIAKETFKEKYPIFKDFADKELLKYIRKGKKMFFIGGAEPMDKDLDEMNKFLLNIVEEKKKNICYVPIALFNNKDLLEEMDSYIDKIEDYYKEIDENVFLSRVRPEDEEDDIIKKIQEADVVYFSGGDTKYLLNRLENNKIVKAIKREYEKGKILVGNSAGALVFLDDICSIDSEGEAHFYKGINFIKKYILIVHYLPVYDKICELISRKFTDKKLIKLKESQAVFICNNDINKYFNCK